MKFPLKALALTILAMIAFAANSVIARQALLEPEIGPLSYTVVRLLSGALVLALLVGPKKSWRSGSWKGAFYLLMYAGLFSLAYISLSAGVGALILFAAVQITMIGGGLVNGERLTRLQSCGAVFAFGGLIYLLNPGLDAPPLIGALLMIGSGVGWGLYSLKGRSSQNATRETGGNFVKATIMAAVLIVPFLLVNSEPTPERSGVLLAILSGAVTSGLGYVVWYAALPSLTAIRAGLAQLTVPAIAAAGGVLFLAEPLTERFLVASVVILLGVGVATLSGPKTIT